MREIITARLVLRPISLRHCTDRYVSWLNDPEVYKFMETRGNYTIDQLREYLVSVIANKVSMWAIHLRVSNQHIGNIKIDPLDLERGLGEYGILMGDKSEWGKGYATEASEAVLNYCFEELKLRKITLGVIRENKAAIKVYKKIGFVQAAVYRCHVRYDDEYYDIIRMAIFNPVIYL